ncbi:Tetratricopeptide repeat protein 25 [Chytriomyces hyalinus]|nr:Tetratricopeptide repeat protein 25 [Chytriomyces hyalinus]KAJ3246923.1 Tetratricopeptide repeat protein 25 [Chytriomyces hyalinus]
MADSKTAPHAGADGLSEGEAPENLIAKFQTLSAEGDLLAQRRSFPEAIDVFTQALNIRPTDKHCLVARSKCYIQVGSAKLALADANESLKEDDEFFKGLFQKAEALYAMGDFELALMFYHRGNRLRPELDTFRIGIQKSREAIENSIGKYDKPKDFKIEISGKLRKNLGALFQTTATSAVVAAPATTTTVQAGAPIPSILESTIQKPMSSKVESKLLGELYEDKVYLQNLIVDKDFVERPNDQIVDLVCDGLRFLETRVEFWRQQNPLYARKKGKKIVPRMERGLKKEPISSVKLPPLDSANRKSVKLSSYSKIPPPLAV